VLHERRITEFAGGYAEWEEVSAERAHAAAVRAAEEEGLRQVHERQRVARKPETEDPRQALRRARRELVEVEAQVAELEAQVGKLVAALEDPALYTRPDGAKTARELGAQLEERKRELDQALERWTKATEKMEETPGHRPGVSRSEQAKGG
jgi:hypothetical protein